MIIRTALPMVSVISLTVISGLKALLKMSTTTMKPKSNGTPSQDQKARARPPTALRTSQ